MRYRPRNRPWLSWVVLPWRVGPPRGMAMRKRMEEDFEIEPSMVRLLLQFGADPNEQLQPESTTTWQSFLQYCVENPRVATNSKTLEVLKLLSQKGNLSCRISYRENQDGHDWKDATARQMITLLDPEADKWLPRSTLRTCRERMSLALPSGRGRL
ncbi:hypothetical protein F5Y15DRAFT_388561 [Xylariaceae sp. FL0016]|nr:hypothetical protein F5Y15DRAFT_388561 [Xylariaceae sp. FL0016]